MIMKGDPEIPFDFILDYLLRIETTIKPFFGMFSIYAGQKLLLILRDRSSEPELNGIWVPTNKDSLESLKAELPALERHFGLTKAKSAAVWLLLPDTSADFERTAISLCDLLVHRDPRIGRLSKPRPARRKR